jgi:four helix bundle protein
MKAAPDWGMHKPLRSALLQDIINTIALARPLLAAIQRRDRDLASQVRRALSSIGLNVAEAFGTASGNARLRFETARGSLYESQAGLQIAVAWGYLDEQQASTVFEALDDLGGRLYGLARR